MQFPQIYDFDEVDTVPSALLDFKDSQLHDVRADPEKLRRGSSPVDVISAQYPRIMKQIELLWGTQELQDRFLRWILTDQDGRWGWPRDVYEALLEISNAHAIKFKLEGNPVWGEKPDRW